MESKAKYQVKCRNGECGKKIYIGKGSISVVSDDSSDEHETKTQPGQQTSFWDLIKSKREADKDILDAMGEAVDETQPETEFQEELKDATAPVTSAETSKMIGELISVAMTQITYLMDPENNKPVSTDQKVSLLSKAAILCLNIQVEQPEGEPYNISPVTLLLIIAVICFLPELWKGATKKDEDGGSFWDKIPFFGGRKKKDESPAPDEIPTDNIIDITATPES